MPLLRTILVASLLPAGVVAWPMPARAVDAPPAPAAMLYLPDGDFYRGSLEDVDQPDTIRWQSPAALRPFEFAAGTIRAIHFPRPDNKRAAEGEFCFELTDGDMLFGSLVGLTPQELEIESLRFGRLHVERAMVRKMTRWDGAAAWEYFGPDGLAGWQPLPDGDRWSEEAGQLLTRVSQSSLRKEIAIPERARIEFCISWTRKPDFVLAFSADATEERPQSGFRFEMWDGYLAVVRELENEADLEHIGELHPTRDGRIQLQAFVDQRTGRISVHSLDGTQLADVEVPHQDEAPWKWLTLTNKRGDLRLEQLTISRWNGQPPLPVDVSKSRIETSSGAVVYGEIQEYRAETGQFAVRQDGEEKLIDADDVVSVALTPSAAPSAGTLRVGFHDGSRISGELLRVADGRLHLSREGIRDELVSPVRNIRSLIGLRSDARPPTTVQWRSGRLELEGMSSRGTFADWTDADGGCLAWQPKYSATSSPLRGDASGRIVYREPRRAASNSPPTQEPQPRNGFFRVFLRATGVARAERAPKPRFSRSHTLYLLAGDRIPCEVSHIDEEGVHFSSSVVETDCVPHEQIKALELASNFVAGALEESKRERLLTLPRMQKNNPPTHLVISTSGDYLRGRLLGMGPDSLDVEARLEAKQLPRERVACIIWLDDGKPAETPADDLSPAQVRPRIQAVHDDGVRLTFTPHESSGNTLVGRSDLLGACSVDVSAVDQIVLGDMIETVADEQTYHAWKLRDAVEPRFVREDGSDGAAPAAGLGSALVGQPAPDFHLARLEGAEFRLSHEKGHVVVLDFWASWCGWCIQAMPRVEGVVREFDAADVKLVAVNMAEDRATVTAALERLQLHPDVVLDVDGATAEKYEVTALPQTVVVDAEGNVARVFVGSDPNLANLLRTTIDELLQLNTSAGRKSSVP